ncbi:MAG: SDR family NAD(P)-dependent oxidoreductase [Henriciella sp.]|nr:SDR family NAD(P)-dependent oxidoreductase [Henriciella sp.]
MTEISGRVAFITGAASGLGLAMAKAFARRGAKVMLSDRDADGLAKAEADLRASGAEVGSVVCDVTDLEAVKAAAKATLERFGKVHLVVNNAGVAIGGQPGAIPIEDWRWIVDINLMGVVHGVEVFTPILQAQGEGGHIVNTASMAGHAALPGAAPYNATKFAVVGYSETLRNELAGEGIGVSALCPGWVNTNIHKTGFERPSGGPTLEQAQSDPTYQQMAAVIEGGLDADAVAEWTADCVEANRLYVFTHADFKAGIEQRFDEVLKDYQAIVDDGRFS